MLKMILVAPWCVVLGSMVAFAAEPAVTKDATDAWAKLAPYFEAPKEFAGDFGKYESPFKFADGHVVKSAAEWPVRRAEILAQWQKRLGAWPPLLEQPRMEVLSTEKRENFTQHRVLVDIGRDKKAAGYLLVPAGQGPFPAVLVTFYEPETSIGLVEKAKGKHDFGYQLAKRGFVTLSIGTPGMVEHPGVETRELLVLAGSEQKMQPLGYLAYVSANCHQALAQRKEVDPRRIGVVGLSYGGKWAMFSSCLYDKFACAVWSDPGIVFDETNGNVNYYEPWYLGFEPGPLRPRGIPSSEKPRTGLYKKMHEAGQDLVDFHALMAPRPVLVSGGTEDKPQNWRALNNLVAVYELLGYRHRVGMTARPTHVPTPEAADQTYAFFEYFLKDGKALEGPQAK